MRDELPLRRLGHAINWDACLGSVATSNLYRVIDCAIAEAAKAQPGFCDDDLWHDICVCSFHIRVVMIVVIGRLPPLIRLHQPPEIPQTHGMATPTASTALAFARLVRHCLLWAGWAAHHHGGDRFLLCDQRWARVQTNQNRRGWKKDWVSRPVSAAVEAVLAGPEPVVSGTFPPLTETDQAQAVIAHLASNDHRIKKLEALTARLGELFERLEG